MRSITQTIATKRQGNREAQLRTRLCQLSYFGCAVEKGGKFHTLFEKEIFELLPKNIARRAKYESADDNCFSKNIC